MKCTGLCNCKSYSNVFPILVCYKYTHALFNKIIKLIQHSRFKKFLLQYCEVWSLNSLVKFTQKTQFWNLDSMQIQFYSTLWKFWFSINESPIKINNK